MLPDLSALPIPESTRRQFDFLVTSHALTGVARLNRLLDDSRGETSAEHSWHLALTAIALAREHAPEVELARVLTMLAIHDLVEVDAGDVPIYDEQARVEVAAAEHRAAARLFGRLPETQGAELLRLWEEFEDARTPEARFARAVDRIQPLLLHWAGNGAVWSARGVTVEQERRLMSVIEEFWPSLGPVAAALIDDAHRRGMLGD
ncbi:HD domain-containing protein [Amycolatopsis anabasis]|uniref:HD domain-containing protein n=1 Tax=Amycolatopsis anabasis TaxID=1840409 RepID=UPI00131AD246|nr:HD domain-containing protein [Amycolatopsis anabasis]